MSLIQIKRASGFELDREIIGSFYFDVNLLTESKTIKAHKVILAQQSSWFHNYFKTRNNVQICDIAFFATSEEALLSAIDIIYGKEVTLPNKEKKRVVWLLDKLGVKWCQGGLLMDSSTGQEKQVEECLSVQNRKEVKEPQVIEKLETVEVSKENEVVDDPSPETSGIKDSFKVPPTASIDDDFYCILDKFTETSDEELKRINHMIIGESGRNDRRYKCLKCELAFKFFTQAERHHLEHTHEEFTPIRDILRKAEQDRAEDSKERHQNQNGRNL